MSILYDESVKDMRQADDAAVIRAICKDRNISDLKSFLKPQFNPPPIDNITSACIILSNAIDKHQKILVVGDSDVDGVSSLVIATQCLMNHDADVEYYIHQEKQHGISRIDMRVFEGVDVVLVVDSIENDSKRYTELTKQGKQVIVLDHHIVPPKVNVDLPGFTLVSSAAGYENPELSGAGVTLRTMLELDFVRMTDVVSPNMWTLAALGITADVCDVATPENRYIISRGLEHTPKWIAAALNGYEFDTKAISWTIAPMINAAIRMKQPELAVDLLFDNGDAAAILEQMSDLRAAQNAIVDSEIEKCKAMIDEQRGHKFYIFPVETDGEFSGLIAGKLVDLVGAPLCVVRNVDGMMKGSMRCPWDIDMCAELNETGCCIAAGHPQASGLSFKAKDRGVLVSILDENLADMELTTQRVRGDVLVTPDQLTDRLVRFINAANRVSGKGFQPITIEVDLSDPIISQFRNPNHTKICSASHDELVIAKWNDDEYKQHYGCSHVVACGVPTFTQYGKKRVLQVASSWVQYD